MMRFPRLALLAALILPGTLPPASLAAEPAAATAAAPLAPRLKTPSYVLLDYRSGKVLAERGADERREPASLTKLMTAFVVFSEIKAGRVKPNDLVKVSKKAWKTPGTRTFLDVGSEVTVDVLLKGLLIQSGNDAAIALAEHVAGSEKAFVALMNQYAARLGLSNTRFLNPHGLPKQGHYSTARDLAKLALAQLRQFPEYGELFATKTFTWNNIKQYNRNKLLWRDPSVDGLKTGYTYRARYCQVASAERDGRRMITVLLGSDNPALRTRETQALLDYGFLLGAKPTL